MAGVRAAPRSTDRTRRSALGGGRRPTSSCRPPSGCHPPWGGHPTRRWRPGLPSNSVMRGRRRPPRPTRRRPRPPAWCQRRRRTWPVAPSAAHWWRAPTCVRWPSSVSHQPLPAGGGGVPVWLTRSLFRERVELAGAVTRVTGHLPVAVQRAHDQLWGRSGEPAGGGGTGEQQSSANPQKVSFRATGPTNEMGPSRRFVKSAPPTGAIRQCPTERPRRSPPPRGPPRAHSMPPPHKPNHHHCTASLDIRT